MPVALVDERISERCEHGLLLRGFRVIKIKGYERLSEPVMSHPDMLIFKHNKTIISSCDYAEKFPYIFTDIRELCQGLSFRFTDDVPECEYPRDVLFNALVIKDKIFLRRESISCEIIDYAVKAGLNVVEVNQGYPACVTLAFGNSAVTADRGIAASFEREGISTTLIENRDISLPPYSYGFIGGASGVFKDTVYFLGDLNTHRDSQKIKAAIERENMKYVSLSDEPLSDLGRIIFID